MYKLCSFNDDCVVDTRTNTAIFKSEEEYTKYEDWARVYIKYNNSLIADKKAALRHNRGLPHISKNEEENRVEELYHHSGQLFEKKVFDGEILLEEHRFVIEPKAKKNADTRLYKSSFYTKGELSRENTYFPNGNIQKRVLNYKTGQIKNSSVMNYAEEGHLYMRLKYKNDKLKNYIKYNKVGNKILEIDYDDKGKLIESNTYYASEGSLQSERSLATYTFRDNCIDYIELYNSGNVRAEGKFNLDFLMDGEWKFYHSNRLLESEYIFNNGGVKSGKIYHEDGSLIAAV